MVGSDVSPLLDNKLVVCKELVVGFIFAVVRVTVVDVVVGDVVEDEVDCETVVCSYIAVVGKDVSPLPVVISVIVDEA